ncbi:uncharacterized protein LOC135698058, partial [Ochlerotatus camptorhynchus]|uniref:uncharacterized protein LOC135698058 n=1 Tax=Ochlerotatus camptorhynchus TaxID=644619 RepID=UPI0031DC11E1
MFPSKVKNGRDARQTRSGRNVRPVSLPDFMRADPDGKLTAIYQRIKAASLKPKLPKRQDRWEMLKNLPVTDEYDNFSLQIGRRGECRVLAETLDGFKCLLKYLTEKKHKFFTYDTKTERVFKVVMKGLPSGESLDQIKDELAKLLGVVPLQVIKMKMKSRPGDSRNGISNDFYLVHFKSSELNNLKALEKASLMLHVRVKWEHFRKTGGNFQNLTQCRKCQGWGHGTKNCYMPAKCMNCGDSSHAKDDCPVKEDPKKFKCSNCGENHKSNFWECKTRKAILQS